MDRRLAHALHCRPEDRGPLPAPERRRFIGALVAAAALPGSARAAPPVHDLQWHDRARARDIPLRVREPHPGARPAGGAPVVLFSHGLGGSRDSGRLWGEAWAAAGFVVVHLQHPGSDTPAVLAAGNDIARVASAQQLRARVEDVRFVLDGIARRHADPESPWRHARASAVGLAGHSFGAHTTLACAGQRHAGHEPVDDPRLAAFVALSPTLPSGDAKAALANIRRPMLCLTGTRDGDVVGNGATAERRAAVFDALPLGAKAMLWLQDADHETFGGSPRWIQSRLRADAAIALEQQHHRMIARITADWWRVHLMHDQAASERLAQPVGLGAGDRWLTSRGAAPEPRGGS